MDARRLELYELLKPTLGEAPAQALVLALPPDPDKLVTHHDLDRLGDRMDALFARIDVRFSHIDAQFARVDARFAEMEATLTRRFFAGMVVWTTLLGGVFSWVNLLLR
jgi:hypothetical protein